MELLQAYLDKYPDSRHKNRVLSLIASAYFMEGKLIIITKSPLLVGGLTTCDDMVVVDVKIFSNVFTI